MNGNDPQNSLPPQQRDQSEPAPGSIEQLMKNAIVVPISLAGVKSPAEALERIRSSIRTALLTRAGCPAAPREEQPEKTVDAVAMPKPTPSVVDVTDDFTVPVLSIPPQWNPTSGSHIKRIALPGFNAHDIEIKYDKAKNVIDIVTSAESVIPVVLPRVAIKLAVPSDLLVFKVTYINGILSLHAKNRPSESEDQALPVQIVE